MSDNTTKNKLPKPMPKSFFILQRTSIENNCGGKGKGTGCILQPYILPFAGTNEAFHEYLK